jgi:hypothetical protein
MSAPQRGYVSEAADDDWILEQYLWKLLDIAYAEIHDTPSYLTTDDRRRMAEKLAELLKGKIL